MKNQAKEIYSITDREAHASRDAEGSRGRKNQPFIDPPNNPKNESI